MNKAQTEALPGLPSLTSGGAPAMFLSGSQAPFSFSTLALPNMAKPKGTIAILTGGGDVPGLNPAIRAVTV
ncbi:MAG: hypothetical protein ACI9W4_001707, partial [Rhodothermales bacterium]